MSIMQPVTKDWLLDVCEKFRYGLPRTEERGVASHANSDSHRNDNMPPPKSKPIRHQR